MSDGLGRPGSGGEREDGAREEGFREDGLREREDGLREDGARADGAGDAGIDPEEQALRRLLQDSVRDIEPKPDSLETLHRAVPARRTHRRQALVGAVAAALVAVVGIPALLYGGVVPGVGDDRHPLTASSSDGQTQGPGEGSESGGGKEGEHPEKSGGKDGKKKGEKGDKDKDDPSAPSGKETGGADPSDSLAASAPTCGREQLGGGRAQAGSPDAEGKVYGSFRVTNTSGDACTVDGEGMVGASTEGGSNTRTRVQVAAHTAGDPATGLPDPAAESDELVLKPGESYLVRFAYVPNQGQTCADDTPEPGTSPQNAGGTGPDAEPTQGADAGGGETGGETGGSGGGTETGGGVGGPGGADGGGDTGGGGTDTGGGTGDDSKVVISHTPDVGTPAAADAVVNGACGGTVYRTGVLPAE